MKQVQNNRTQRLLLCVLLSVVVHAGLAATFVSAIRSKPTHLEILNPIQVSLFHEVSNAIGTGESQSVESDLNQFLGSGVQTTSIDLIQLAEDSTDLANEVADELNSTAVLSASASQPTDFFDIDQPTPPLPIVKKEVNKEIPDAKVQPVITESGDISPSTNQLSESNELESTESAYVEVEEEPMPTESESLRDLHLTEPVEKLTAQVTNSGINNEIEHITESNLDLVSSITPFDFSHFELHESAEGKVDSSDADKIAGVWSTDVMEPATTKFHEPSTKEPTPDENAESQIQVEDIAALSNPVSITAIAVVQFSPPEITDDEHFTDEIDSTSSLETESDIDEQFTDKPPSNIPQTGYLNIDDEIQHIWESEYQADSDMITADGVNSPMQAGILFSGVVEPATTEIDRQPTKESSPEKFAESQIEVSSIAELSHPVAITTIEVVQFLPSEIVDAEHFTDEIASTSSLETETNIDEQLNDNPPSEIIQITYSTIEANIERSMETDYQPVSNIAPVENSNVPISANAELVAEISDADDLAGIWPTEAIEPANLTLDQPPLNEINPGKVVESDQLSSSEVTPEDFVETQIQVASATDLIKPVQHDANQVEPEYLPAPKFLVSKINQATSDLEKEATNEKTTGLNDSWLTTQVPSATDQLAYAPPILEPMPIREDIQATDKTSLEDQPLRDVDPPEITTRGHVIEPEVNESETKRKEEVPKIPVENQPEFENSSLVTIHESPNRTDLAETDEKSIPKERHQVASIDPVQPTANSSDQGMTDTFTQESSLGNISSDVRPKYGIEGLSNQVPRYPYLSRVNDEQGRVILRVVVDRKGRAKEVEVIESSGFSRLDKAARKAVKRWRFQPAQKNGLPTQGVVQVPINFVLDSS